MGLGSAMPSRVSTSLSAVASSGLADLSIRSDLISPDGHEVTTHAAAIAFEYSA